MPRSARHEVARFYLDENVSTELSDVLVSAGHDVLSTDDAGRKGNSDVRQLVFAAREGRIAITHNRDDFVLVHEAWIAYATAWGVARPVKHPGISVLPQPPLMPSTEAADEIDRVSHVSRLANRIWVWRRPLGWYEPALAIDVMQLDP